MIDFDVILGSAVYRANNTLNNSPKFKNDLLKYPYARNLIKDSRIQLSLFNGSTDEIAAIFRLAQGKQGVTRLKYPAILNIKNSNIIVNHTEKEYTPTFSLVIASLVNSEWDTEKRKNLLFEPLLRPVYDAIIKELDRTVGVEFSKSTYNYTEIYGTGAAEDGDARYIKTYYGDYIDSIQLTRLQLVVSNLECQYDIMLNEYNKLMQDIRHTLY